jgi:ABC transporter substrate binding protein (PQQ-dependent alcohol dehydrogenase system)
LHHIALAPPSVPQRATVSRAALAARDALRGLRATLGARATFVTVIALATVTALPGTAAAATMVQIGYLQIADDPRYDDKRLYARNLAQGEGRPAAGLETAIRESSFATAALGVTLAVEHAEAADAAGLVGEIDRLEKRGVRFFVIDAPGPVVAEVAAATRGKALLLLNVAAADDALRQNQCQAHLLHTLPSHAMRADALAQYLVSRKWRKVLVLQGPLAEDALQAAAFARAAKRFGLTLVDTRRFVLSNDPRQREQGNVALLTGGKDYDAIFVADSDGEFARGVPYRSVLPRPVIGAEGLVATAWHWSWERHGAPQLSSRFEKQARRRMGESDWAAWIAGKAIVEAMQRTGGVDFKKVAAWLRGTEITLDGFKGNRLSFRPWDNQLRQPLLIATHNAVIERTPIEGFLHPHNKLDTLGFDQPDSSCRFN